MYSMYVYALPPHTDRPDSLSFSFRALFRHMNIYIREGVKKTFFLGPCPKLWVGGSKVPKFLVKITIQLFYLFLGLCPKIGVAVDEWGSRVPNKYMELCPKNFSFLKKIKCSKQPKKQNKPNFYFSLSGVPNVRGGWVGSDVWDKVPKKRLFLHLP